MTGSAISSFDDMRLGSDRRLVMVAMALVLVPALWFFQVDVAMFGKSGSLLTQRFTVRSALILVAAWGIWRMRTIEDRADYARTVLLLTCSLGACLFTLNALRPEGATLPLRTPLQNLMVMYGAMPNRRRWQVTPPLLFSAGLVLLRLSWLTGNAAGDLSGDLLVLAVVNAVGVLMVWRRTALEESERATLQTAVHARQVAEQATGALRSLEGIIPICSHCHQVRTEAGAWKALDHYVRERTDADFSHGICPQCSAVHYPGMLEDSPRL